MTHWNKLDITFTWLRFTVALLAAWYCLSFAQESSQKFFWLLWAVYLSYSIGILLLLTVKPHFKDFIYKITSFTDMLLILIAGSYDHGVDHFLIYGIYVLLIVHSIYFGLKFGLVLIVATYLGFFLVHGHGILESTTIFDLIAKIGLGVGVPILVGYLSDTNRLQHQRIQKLNRDLINENSKQEKLLQELQENKTTLSNLYNFSQFISDTKDTRELFPRIIAFISERMPEKKFAICIKRKVQSAHEWNLIAHSPNSQPLHFHCLGIKLIGELSDRGSFVLLEAPNIVNAQLCGLKPEDNLDECKEGCIFHKVGNEEIQMTNKLIMPFMADNRVYGSLVIFSPQQHSFSAHDIDFFKSLSQQISVAIDKSLAFHRLKVQSETDPLTGCYNRRSLLRLFIRYRYQALVEKESLSFVIIDLDHFKKVNDSYGHQVGDSLLISFCQLVFAEVRQHDIFGRYGGEEFILLLPQTSKENAVSVAEKLRTKVSKLRIAVKSNQYISFTISSGVATIPEDGKRLKEIIAKSDQALYKAKASGRNQTIAYGDDLSIEAEKANTLVSWFNNLQEYWQKSLSQFLAQINVK